MTHISFMYFGCDQFGDIQKRFHVKFLTGEDWRFVPVQTWLAQSSMIEH